MEAKFRTTPSPPQKKSQTTKSMGMKFFQKNSGYTLFDHKRNGEILEEMKIEPADKKLRKYKSDWLRHVTRL
jgi:hypothetical protein